MPALPGGMPGEAGRLPVMGRPLRDAARNRDIPRCFDSKENSGRRWLDNKNIQIVETIRIHAPDMCCNFGFPDIE
ncbi:TPA: hypothetical protein QDB04_006538 [Burkholderia vietnamiensis]|nr:hypothetical protein [Burkholderia vietnamiensis]